MLYDTLSQPVLFLIFALAGMFSCLAFCLIKIAKKYVKNIIICNIFDFFGIFLIFFSLFLTNLFFHYGIFRIFPILIFFTFFFLSQLLFEKHFAKLFSKCYTLFKGKRNGKNKS